MKWKKIALLLSFTVAVSGSRMIMANAEDFIFSADEDEAEAMIADMADEVGTDEYYSENEPMNDEPVIPESVQSSDSFTENTLPEITDFSDESLEEGTDFSVEEDHSNTESIDSDFSDKEQPEINNTYFLQSYVGSVESGDCILGDNPASTLKVCSYANDMEVCLEETNYTVLGYITEEEYINADHALDNLNSFSEEPTETGKWLLVFEGITPYFGRQAVYINVHDYYDISIYDWSLNDEIIAGEDPKASLQVFRSDNGVNQILDKDAYEVLGYVTEEDYIAAGCNLGNLTSFSSVVETSGTWLLVFEGRNDYYGRNAAWISADDAFDLSEYQCLIKSDEIMLGESVEEFVEVSRSKYEYTDVLSEEHYKIAGYISEKDFAAAGYDLNTSDNIQSSVNASGGWYILIEGTEPYYGRIAAWFNVNVFPD